MFVAWEGNKQPRQAGHIIVPTRTDGLSRIEVIKASRPRVVEAQRCECNVTCAYAFSFHGVNYLFCLKMGLKPENEQLVALRNDSTFS